MRILGKIENKEAIKNIDEILDSSDGIVIARHILSLELSPEEMSQIQKELLTKALKKNKLGIIGGKIMHSMINQTEPTEEEINDLRQIVVDGAACCMLCGETSIGEYPSEVTKKTVEIITNAERDLNILDFDEIIKESPTLNSENKRNQLKKAVNLSLAYAAIMLRAKAIVCVSNSGNSPKILSACRPPQPIYVITTNDQAAEKNNLFWGVQCVVIEASKEDDYKTKLNKGIEVLLEQKLLEKGDTIIIWTFRTSTFC